MMSDISCNVSDCDECDSMMDESPPDGLQHYFEVRVHGYWQFIFYFLFAELSIPK
jgi:hypothetical protein